MSPGNLASLFSTLIPLRDKIMIVSSELVGDTKRRFPTLQCVPQGVPLKKLNKTVHDSYKCDWIYGNHFKSHFASFEIIDFKAL